MQIIHMLTAALPKAELRGHQLNALHYQGCQGCMACKQGSLECVVQDELSPVLADIACTDLVIIASPVYFGEISAQAKALVDRLYWALPDDYLSNPDGGRIKPGKTLILILTQGHPDSLAYGEVAAKYSRVFSRMGFSDVYIIRGLGLWGERRADTSPSVKQQVSTVLKRLSMQTAVY